MNRLLVPVAAVGLSVACSGPESATTPPSTTEAAVTTTEVVVENPLCLALDGLAGALAEDVNPTSSIEEVEAALNKNPDGSYAITDDQTVEQLADVMGATSTAGLVAPDPLQVERSLVVQALDATAQAIASNCPTASK